MTLPGALKETGYAVFEKCQDLKTLYLEEGCAAKLSCTEIPSAAAIVPLSTAIFKGISVLDLRKQTHIVIPEGTERIENCLFWGSQVESVEIPASVTEIGACAFCCCAKLKKLTFRSSASGEHSRLKVIGQEAFYGCSSLRDV